MPPNKRRVRKQHKKRHIILALFLAIACIFLFFEESGKDDARKLSKAGQIPSKTAPSAGLPKISIVMDDLGPNKGAAETVFTLNAPLTLSILPHEKYSEWIAKEGRRLGHRIIVHVPMEAAPPRKLGKGALQTWMTDREIAETLSDDIRSIPDISGVSSHMGSAFTKDERAMRAVVSELKKHHIFFLDSFTTPGSRGYKIAKEEGLAALRRDVFLDDKDDLREIEAQWQRLLKISREKGYAIALAHPRKNTLKFLKKALKENNNIEIVPVTELITD